MSAADAEALADADLGAAAAKLLGDRRLIIATNRGPVTFTTARRRLAPTAPRVRRPRHGPRPGRTPRPGDVGGRGDERGRSTGRGRPTARARGARRRRAAATSIRLGRARRLRAGLQRHRQPAAVVPPAPDVEPAGAPDHRRRHAARLGARVRRDERGVRRRHRRADAGRQAPADHAPRLPPLLRRRADPTLPSAGHPQPLHPHPDAAIVDLAGGGSTHPRGHRDRAPRERRRRLPDRSVRPQLPAHGRVVRPRRDGRLREERGAAPAPDDAGADLPDQHRRRRHEPDRRVTRRPTSRRPAARGDPRAGHRPRRPARAVEEHPARLPRLRGASPAPLAPPRPDQLPGVPGPVADRPARVRPVRADGAERGRADQRPIRTRGLAARSSSSTRTTTPRRWRASRSPTSCSSIPSSTG